MSEELTAKRMLNDFKVSYEFKKETLDRMQSDFEYALGKQWEDKDLKTLEDVGVKGLTINKLKPIINLLVGTEAQNRTDLKCFPEGSEDTLTGEISTILLKNIVKNSKFQYKVSDVFKEGVTGGECYLEPWIDYTKNMLFGKMKFAKLDYYRVFPDPDFKEYDMSDAKYINKVTYDLMKDELISLFPDKEEKINKIENGKISMDTIGQVDKDATGTEIQKKGYEDSSALEQIVDEPKYDLLERFYKKYIRKYYVADMDLGDLKEAKSKEEADAYLAETLEQKPDAKVRVIDRYVPEIWVASVIGNGEEILEDKRAWSFPLWDGYPIIPFFADRMTTRLKDTDRHLLIQGVIRGLKDLQHEFNKRRTQELRILNTSANSGWLAEQDSWVNPQHVDKFGSSPGVRLEYKAGKPKPERITPTPKSHGHSQLAEENTMDLKEASGINTDLLAMQEGGTDSGRAIALRQRQGMVMIQQLFDNLSQTKMLAGKFMLSQLSNIFDIDYAMKVLGEGFIGDNFSEPVMVPAVNPISGQPIADPQNPGQPVMTPAIDPVTQELQMRVNVELAAQTVNGVINDPTIADFDVSVGEIASTETVKYANYLTLLDFVKNGIPIPPDVLVDESLLSSASKRAIKEAIQAAQRTAENENAGSPGNKEEAPNGKE